MSFDPTGRKWVKRHLAKAGKSHIDDGNGKPLCGHGMTIDNATFYQVAAPMYEPKQCGLCLHKIGVRR